MRKLFALIVVFALLIGPAFAHPGDTDSSGGHYDRSTGEYHYHHGYPAHQHPNGVCPFDFADKTGERSGPSVASTRKASIRFQTDALSAYDAYKLDELESELEARTHEASVFSFLFLTAAAIVVALIVSLICMKRKMDEADGRWRMNIDKACQLERSRADQEYRRALFLKQQEFSEQLALEIRKREQLTTEHRTEIENRRQLQAEMIRELRQLPSYEPVETFEDMLSLPTPPDLSKGAVLVQRGSFRGQYHHSFDCAYCVDPIYVSKVIAEKMGFEPCIWCTRHPQPETDITVETSIRGGSVYHRTGSPCLQSLSIKMPLSEALAKHYRPCLKCKPPEQNPKVWF